MTDMMPLRGPHECSLPISFPQMTPESRKIRLLSSTRILQQAGWLAGAKITQGIAGILATFAVARHLGPGVFGQLSLAIAVASFVATAATLGLEHIATRELASGSVRSPLKTLFRLRILGGASGTALLLCAASLTAARSGDFASLLLVLSLLPLVQAGDVAEWRLIAAGQSRRVAIIVIAVSPIAAFVRLWMALEGVHVLAFCWILIAEWAIRSAALQVATGGLLSDHRPATSEFVADARALLRDSMPLLMSGIAVFIYMRVDQFMIAGMLGTEQVGLYSAVVTLAEAPLVLPALLLRAALPILTKESEIDPAIRDRTLSTLMRAMFYLHALIALGLSLFSEPIIVFLYGEPFRAAAAAFSLQVLAAPFVALGVLSAAWLVLERCTGHALRRTLIGAVSNVLLNLLLIPRFGIAGAAAATLFAQLLATYVADVFFARTRDLFMMKTWALFPLYRWRA